MDEYSDHPSKVAVYSGLSMSRILSGAGLWLLMMVSLPSWSVIDSFGYQLQDFDSETLRDSPLSLVIIDYSSDGTQEGALSRQAVDAIRGKTGKKVLAYLSIGEAEDYRYY